MADRVPGSSNGPDENGLLVRTFVQLADSLVADFDVIDTLTLLATRSLPLLNVDAAGIMFFDQTAGLRVMALSTEYPELQALFDLQARGGPCLDCCTSGEPIEERELATSLRWPEFTKRAVADGYRSLHAVPMRLRGVIAGALNLVLVEPGGMTDDDVVTAQALADVATIAVLSSRAVTETQRLNEQMRAALESRIVIEQAKGALAEALGVPIPQAFAALRGFARDRNLLLSEVARGVVTNSLSPQKFSAPR